jgi:hypothetical protein
VDARFGCVDRLLDGQTMAAVCRKRSRQALGTKYPPPRHTGHNVGNKEVSDRIWLVTFVHYDLGSSTANNSGPNRSTAVRPYSVSYVSGKDCYLSIRNGPGGFWRRVRDSNPRYVAVYLISSQAPSTTRPTLREGRIIPISTGLQPHRQARPRCSTRHSPRINSPANKNGSLSSRFHWPGMKRASMTATSSPARAQRFSPPWPAHPWRPAQQERQRASRPAPSAE